MWHYLFFIVLVKVKDSTEYTGPESYVAEMIKVNIEQRHTRLPSHAGLLLYWSSWGHILVSHRQTYLWKARKIGISAAKQAVQIEINVLQKS